MSQPEVSLREYPQSMIAACMAWMAGDKKPMLDHCLRFGIQIPSHELAQEGMVRKVITSNTAFPMELRSEAKRWLLVRGFESWDDGDVPV